MAITRGPSIVRDGLVLCLDAKDPNSYSGSGSTWSDVSSNDYDGTINGATYNSGGYFAFDGSDDFVNFGNVLDSLTSLTLECFVKIHAQSSSYNGIISKTLDNSNGYEMRMGTYTSTTTGVQFRYVGDNVNLSFGQLTNELWYHLVATGTSGSQKIYTNASLTTSSTSTSTPSSNTNSLVLGKLAYASLYADMDLASVRIYNRALSASEVLQNYNAQKSRF